MCKESFVITIYDQIGQVSGGGLSGVTIKKPDGQYVIDLEPSEVALTGREFELAFPNIQSLANQRATEMGYDVFTSQSLWCEKGIEEQLNELGSSHSDATEVDLDCGTNCAYLTSQGKVLIWMNEEIAKKSARLTKVRSSGDISVEGFKGFKYLDRENLFSIHWGRAPLDSSKIDLELLKSKILEFYSTSHKRLIKQ
ncbi:hypothetical protein [Vibrio barjaei]|uniref:hypothetical protein n=1 Tax=Vibrio barjaei TaxID=1676683 RepID=UPI0022834DE5|nr:hypothetical protein [Vibrio barjaei]MCY9873843.1 hypothetical protein [Vibrio barjaei]